MTSTPTADLRTLVRFAFAKRLRSLLLVVMLMPVAAAAEMLMISAIVPMLAILGGSSVDLPILSNLLVWIGQIAPGSTLLAAALMFVVIAVATAVLRLILSWSTLRFSAGLAHDLNLDIQHRLLHQPYLFHVGSNSSRLLSSLDKVDHIAMDLVQRGIQGISATIISLAVIAALLNVDPISAVTATLLVILLYGAALLAVRGLHASRSGIMAREYERRIQLLQENLGGIRDIIIDQSQAAHLAILAHSDERFMRARAEALFLSSSPRYLVEGIGLGIIALLGLFVATRPGGVAMALPVLGALALGAQRLLPLTSQIYNAWISVTASGPMIGDIAALLRLELDRDNARSADLPFRRQISLEHVGFSYPGQARKALHDLSFSIPQGARVAIVGKTGSGKSTLADLLMGLIEPTEGQIRIDGELLEGSGLAAWRNSVAHVPQSIFLADASIARNIAFSSPDKEPELARVRRAGAIAQLDEFVAALPQGYETPVGERGIRLSGGQRQRLGLARAVYKQASLLVLDEATSALDEATEAAVLASLDEFHAGGRTIIVIAHRLSTIERCDLVIKLDHGELAQFGSFAEVFGRSSAINRKSR